MGRRAPTSRAGVGRRDEVVHRVTVDEINPKRVKVRSEQLLGFWRSRGASRVRVLNSVVRSLSYLIVRPPQRASHGAAV